MKKGLILVLVASFVLSLAGTALAFPVDFSGDMRLQGRIFDNNLAGADESRSFFQIRSRVRFEGKIDDSTSFFGRFSASNKLGAADYGRATEGAFDQFGVKLVDNGWTFKIGRQAANLGQGAIISTGYNAAGLDNKFDGLTVAGTAGAVDVNVIAGKTNNEGGNDYAIEYYGLDLTTKLDDKFSVGAAYSHSKPDTTAVKGRNIWAINFTATPSSNLTFNGEYAKANTDTLNKAYFINGTYAWDKDSFSIQYNRVEKDSVDALNSAIGVGIYPYNGTAVTPLAAADYYKGFTYTYTHQMTKNASFHLIYMDLNGKDVTGSDKEIISGVVWKF